MAEQMNNINFNINTKKKFTIDDDENKVIELDLTDVNIVNRYSNTINKLQELKEEYKRVTELANKITEDVEENEDVNLKDTKDFSSSFSNIESKMREYVDYIFDSKICDTILGNSSIFSPTPNGMFKYEQILDVLSTLYAEHIQDAMSKFDKRHIDKHISKYTRDNK